MLLDANFWFSELETLISGLIDGVERLTLGELLPVIPERIPILRDDATELPLRVPRGVAFHEGLLHVIEGKSLWHVHLPHSTEPRAQLVSKHPVTGFGAVASALYRAQYVTVLPNDRLCVVRSILRGGGS